MAGDNSEWQLLKFGQDAKFLYTLDVEIYRWQSSWASSFGLILNVKIQFGKYQVKKI